MPQTKKYAAPDMYEKKLERVMERFQIPEGKYDWDYSRGGAWVEFYYKGSKYRFEHSVENARKNGQDLHYGSDAFAQIVLALEDLARITNRGIYDLQSWIAGMKMLPERANIPSFCGILGLDHIPKDSAEVHAAYKRMSKLVHPDVDTGSKEDFQRLSDAKDEALAYLSSNPAQEQQR